MRASAYIFSFLLAVAVIAAPTPAHAGVGLGVFVGEPLGVTLKVDLKKRTALEVLVGVDDWDEDRGNDEYAHVTFLASIAVAKGESVLIPFRLGIGGAVYDDRGDDDINFAVRAPFQIAFQFRTTPVELYLELALRFEVIDDEGDDDHLQLDGGIGFRFYF
jgi:hypothetical protein